MDYMHLFLSYSWILMLSTFALHNGTKAQKARLISSCQTAMGTGRCSESIEACQAFGGIIADEIRFPTLPKPEPACEKGQECCVLLPLPTEDSCVTCGLTGLTDTKIAGNEVPRRILPEFDVPRWNPFVPRDLGDGDEIDEEDDGFDELTARISKLSKPNKWCWQVALTDKNGVVFGSGALIDGQNVLTLAHKVADRRPEDIVLVLGASDFLRQVDKTDDAMWFTTPNQIFIHQQFDSMSFANDMAILRIPLAPCRQRNICPVCINDLPAGSDPNLDKLDNCFITGWGASDAAGFPTVLRETAVKIIDNSKCHDTLTAIGIVGFSISETLFCSRSKRDLNISADPRPCESDGGAPLVCKGADDKWYLRGLVTLGIDACAFEASSPILSTDVGMLFNWIKIQVRNKDSRFSSIPGVPDRALIRNKKSVHRNVNKPTYADGISSARSYIPENVAISARNYIPQNVPEQMQWGSWNPFFLQGGGRIYP